MQKFIDQKLIEDFNNLLIINSHQFFSLLMIHSSAESFLKKNEGRICSPEESAWQDSYYFNIIFVQIGA